jgi:hypothetical protein
MAAATPNDNSTERREMVADHCKDLEMSTETRQPINIPSKPPATLRVTDSRRN